MMGLLHCGGSNQVKVKIFYNLLQDVSQTWIAAQDKDFAPSFSKMLKLASIFVFKSMKESEPDSVNFTDEDFEKMEEEFETITEEFLDAIFDYESKLDREVWEKIVVDKCAW
eukprot:CAMPEP_0116878140 /NCGR_PEP_ID=MMETSP0463-20121206/9862_1 /TAXON_ID=181622 /ORGANISM="Strombidinopsis sp, Strain SopsisLIS2011" /LENGTH=111 /DNA_ID=CAMNT_0004526007 /DNA_START=349 /DNA_END=681 /DNA_ORIENTATION=-